MDGTEFTRLVRRVHPMQGLRLTFNRQTGIIGLNRLRLLCEHNPSINIDKDNRIVVLAVLASRNWDGDYNRTVGVRGLQAAEEEFLYQLGRDVDSLELSGEHGAKGIMVKRQKSRNEAMRVIIDGVLTADLVHEIEDWNLTITGEPTEYLGTPAIQFMICKLDGEMILRITLDGWTGRFGIDGNVNNGPDELYIRPAQLQHFIRVSLEKRLEELTTSIAA